jgi:hypothetical protein
MLHTGHLFLRVIGKPFNALMQIPQKVCLHFKYSLVFGATISAVSLKQIPHG